MRFVGATAETFRESAVANVQACRLGFTSTCTQKAVEHMANVEAIAIEDLKASFFEIMDEACLPDMDEPALELYQLRHADDEEQICVTWQHNMKSIS